MKRTEEQESIISRIKQEDLVLIDACAGAGKTTLLIEVFKELNPKNGLYLAYNKSVAIEAKTKFPKNVHCSTSHSFAFQNTIKSYGLSIGTFFWKSIKERIPYEQKLVLLDTMKEWCLSKYDKFDDFREAKTKQGTNTDDRIFNLTKEYFNKMVKGKIPITHDGYLKFYHMLLAHKKIKHKEFDLIAIDEIGDINEVTYAIFKLLPAKKKIGTGDRCQNIYTFNHTINIFDNVEDKETIMSMSQSFRCHIDIAKRIDAFGKRYVDPNKNFIGVEYDDLTPKTSAYISRNNAQLIDKMITFKMNNTKYNLLRPVDSIFELVLILLSVNNEDTKITKGDYKYLQQDINDYDYSMTLQSQFDSPLQYIKNIYGEDPGFKTAFALIREHGPMIIYDTYNDAKSHEKEKTKHSITLGTVFGTKGSEFDKVTIMEDLNRSMEKIFSETGTNREEFSKEDKTTMLLYYTACSRAKKVLMNAYHLPSLDEIEMEK